jgi:hypothetical protein
MGKIKVTPVISKYELKQFIKLPWNIYKDYPFWVPPLIHERKKILNKEKNPFFQHAESELFIAWIDGKPVGRIAAIKNNLHNKYHSENSGFFGFFECINNQEAANRLFDEAVRWLKSKNLDLMKGPANPSSNNDWGLLIDGFEYSPSFMMPYNPEYYISLFSNYGFQKAKDLLGYRISRESIIQNEKIKKVVEIAKARYKVTVREINIKNFESELEKVKYIYNKAWAPNWGFVPFTDNELNAIAHDLKELIEPSLALFAEVDGEPVGFTLTMPDYNYIFKKMNGRLFPLNFLKLITEKKNIEWARILTLGIIPEYRKKGVDALLYYTLLNNGIKMGLKFAEASWILEDNEMMNNSVLNLGGELFKKYRIYQIDL